MSIHRFIAERRDSGVFLQKMEATVARTGEVLPTEGGLMGVAIAGEGDPDALARAAAEAYFERHPEDKKVFVLASTRSVEWTWKE